MQEEDGYVFEQDEVVLVHELATAREAKADAEWREKQARQAILDILGNQASDIALTGSGARLCHIERQHRRTINRDKLQALYPEVFEDVVEENEVIVLRVD